MRKAGLILTGLLLVLAAIFVFHRYETRQFGDLRLLSIELAAQLNIPEQDKYWSPGTITRPLLRVNFSSNYDLQHLAVSGSRYIGQKTGICKNRLVDSERLLEGFPNIFDKSGRIDEFGKEHLIGKAPFIYHAYFDAEQRGFHDWYAYDLFHQPQDVCIQLNSYRDLLGEIPIWGFHSNVLVIPKQEIARALLSK